MPTQSEFIILLLCFIVLLLYHINKNLESIKNILIKTSTYIE
jgi:hypothetical protein